MLVNGLCMTKEPTAYRVFLDYNLDLRYKETVRRRGDLMCDNEMDQQLATGPVVPRNGHINQKCVIFVFVASLASNVI